MVIGILYRGEIILLIVVSLSKLFVLSRDHFYLTHSITFNPSVAVCFLINLVNESLLYNNSTKQQT